MPSGSDLMPYLTALTQAIRETRISLSEPLHDSALIDIISEISKAALESKNPRGKDQATRLINWLNSPQGRNASAELIIEKVKNFSLTCSVWDLTIDQLIEKKLQKLTPPENEESKDELVKYKHAEKKAFIIMPFESSFSDVWEGAIRRACKETQYEPLRVDTIKLSSFITEDIKQNLKDADVVIVDVSNNNPNVMFELGWALATRKKVIVLCQSEFKDKVPFDIKDIRRLHYELSWAGIESLKEELKEYIGETEKKSRKRKGKSKISKEEPPKKS